MKLKKKCDNCGLTRNKIVRVHGYFVCQNCKKKIMTVIPTLPKFIPTINQALKKIYEVKFQSNNQGQIYLPRCLVGYKVKLQVVGFADEK